jgi:2,5-diketo-D-gluconate reductase A
VTVAWRPLGRGGDLLAEPTLATIATRYGKSPAQVVLRWFVQLGVVPIPRSTNPGRLAENLAVFDFALTEGEVAAISALDTGAEERVDSDAQGH